MSQRPVIIVGAGPVGLGAALELARFGVRSVVLEQYPKPLQHPKTRNFNTRTMEIARGWGHLVYEVIRESHRYGNHLGVELGNWYQSAAVIPDGTTPPSVDDDYSDYQPSAVPGCRAPHVALGPHGAVSTLDLFANSFTILAGPDGHGWVAAAERLRAGGAPVVGYRIGAPGLDLGSDDDGQFLHTYALEADGAVLVRPDGYVAWRSVSAPAAVGAALDAAELDTALRQILGTARRQDPDETVRSRGR